MSLRMTSDHSHHSEDHERRTYHGSSDLLLQTTESIVTRVMLAVRLTAATFVEKTISYGPVLTFLYSAVRQGDDTLVQDVVAECL